MQYQSRLPEENNNITHIHPLKEFITLLAGVLGFFVLSYIVLGFFVDLSVEHISQEFEAKIFNKLPFSALAADEEKNSPELVILQELTDRMSECAGVSIPITIHLDNSDTVNAFALPGGHIVIFRGLLDLLESENSVSFVVGHELGHFINRDHLRGMGRGIIFTAISAAFAGPDSSLTKLFTPAIGLTHAQYSQHRESLADIAGLNALNCFYGHVGGATEFFEKLAATEDPGVIRHFFSSHPEMLARIRELKKHAQMNHYTVEEVVPLSL